MLQRVLVIDDDDGVRDVTCMALEVNGYSAVGVSSGSEGIRELSKNFFDLVICDLFMPKKDGIETVMEIRRDHPALSVIVMTGGCRLFPKGEGGLEELLLIFEFLGVSKFLAKPFRRSELISLVEAAILGG